jgi:hypothetical protein
MPGFKPWIYEDCNLYTGQIKLMKDGKILDELSKRLADGALEGIGNGYVGRTIGCKCGDVMEYRSNHRWILTSLNGKLDILELSDSLFENSYQRGKNIDNKP